MLHTLATVLAFGWEPEIRGITTVLIGVVVLCGSVYLLLATNLGARLGFLVAFAGLFGWMASMGLIWWVYGIGLQGDAPTWQAKEVVLDGDLTQSQFGFARIPDTGAVPEGDAGRRCDTWLLPSGTDEPTGWVRLSPEDPGFGQAVASADDILVNQAELFQTGEFQAANVFDKGGQRFPMCFTLTDVWNFGDWAFDYLAFFHEPHYAIVEVAPLVPQRTEPGRPPPTPVVDESRPSVYVVMERDRGSRRQPAALITIGSGIIFGLSCWALARRDRLSDRNREEEPEPAKVPATVGS